MSQCRLDFGPLDLVDADGGSDFRFGVIGEDLSFGQPQPVEVSVASLMADGSPTSTTRWENREAGFQVTIEAPDAQALADGEAALAAVIGTRTTLTWQPPDDYGPASVFQVETSSMEFLFSDLDETRARKRRTYRLRLVCLPWVRSVNPTTVGSAFVADSVSVKDACESTTGWSRTDTGATATFTVDSTAGNFATGTGSVKFVGSYSGAGQTNSDYAFTSVHKTLSFDASSGGYLTLKVRTGWQLQTTEQNAWAWITTSGGGKQAVKLAAQQAAENGFTRLSWAIPNNSTVTALDLTLEQYRNNAPSTDAARAIWFDEIGLAGNSSAGQASRTFTVEGSARAEGSIAISSTAGLGDVLLYTTPDLGDGFRPDLRRWQVSGSTATETTSASGSYTSITGTPAAVMEAPLSSFRPGTYAVLAQIKMTSGNLTSAIKVDAQALVGGTLIGPVSTLNTSVDFGPDVTNYLVYSLGTLELPPTVMAPESTGKIRFTVSNGPSAARLGELLVFPLDDAALTWVQCGIGSPSPTVASRLWIDEPSPTQPRGAIRIGTDQYRADARAVTPKARGRHLLTPGPMFAYLLTSTAGASMATTYYRRWHSNAGA